LKKNNSLPDQRGITFNARADKLAEGAEPFGDLYGHQVSGFGCQTGSAAGGKAGGHEELHGRLPYGTKVVGELWSESGHRQDSAPPEGTGCAESQNTKTIGCGRRARAAAASAATRLYLKWKWKYTCRSS
jgi:hypothetical protein